MATSRIADAHEHHEPQLLPFDWADPFDLNAQLSDEERPSIVVNVCMAMLPPGVWGS